MQFMTEIVCINGNDVQCVQCASERPTAVVNCLTAPLISSWLIMSQQLFRTCFQIVNVLEFLMTHKVPKSTTNKIIHGLRSDELDDQFDGSIKSETFFCRKTCVSICVTAHCPAGV